MFVPAPVIAGAIGVALLLLAVTVTAASALARAHLREKRLEQLLQAARVEAGHSPRAVAPDGELLWPRTFGVPADRIRRAGR